MKLLKVCHTCDRIIGEIEMDDLTGQNMDSIMDIVGNVAYALCSSCAHEMEIQPRQIFH